VPFTILQKSAVDGHGPSQSSCDAWVGLFVPSGIPSHGCFSGSTLPTTSTPDPARDYNGVTKRDGCRATVNDIQVNVWGRRAKDGFAAAADRQHRRPVRARRAESARSANPGKITFAQFWT
jgi:hypothetical protein